MRAFTQIDWQGSARRRWLVAACCIVLAGCGGGSGGPEEALRAWLAAAEEEVEAKERRAILARISPDYADARGNEREDLDRVLRYLFLRQNTIALLVNIEQIEVFADTAASLRFTVGMAASNDYRALGFSADAYRFDLDMRLVDGDWLVFGARWGELGEDLR